MSKLFRIIYCSHSCIPDDPHIQKAELEQILATSRANNRRDDITGALLFARGSFAQALEGSRDDIEMTLARIAQDPRHSQVRTLEIGPIDERDFPDWAMAFAGKHVSDNPVLAQTLDQAIRGLPSRGADILQFLRMAI